MKARVVLLIPKFTKNPQPEIFDNFGPTIHTHQEFGVTILWTHELL